jgi:RNA polymerase sigma-70 factor (ECF subfamily)
MNDSSRSRENGAPLVALFLHSVPEDRRARFQAVPDFGTTLALLASAARSAWPEIHVDAGAFVAFLGRCLPVEAAPGLTSLRAAELYLVCAYGLGAPGASRALEEHYMPRVRSTLGRLGTPPSTIADIQQDLRQRLVEMQSRDSERRGYEGRGDLAAWLCVSAVREAGRLRKNGTRQRPLGETEATLLVSPDGDPELYHLRSTYKEEFQAAFRRAVASLSSRERNLLLYHFVEGRTIDQLGGFYGVHRATAARWINDARESLCLRTRELLAERISLSHEGFSRLLNLIESQLDVGGALAPTP